MSSPHSYMDIGDFFRSPSDRIAAFAQIQLHLYRRDACFQDYFEALAWDTLIGPRANLPQRSLSERIINGAIRYAGRAARGRPRQKIKTDVLFCPNPGFGRKTEVRFLIRTLLALAKMDAKVLCLLPAGAPSQDHLNAELAAVGRSGQVVFMDPAAPWDDKQSILLARSGRIRGHSAFEEAVQILAPYGLLPTREVEGGFDRLAYFIEAWDRLAPWIEFEAVVARCHWLPLCSPVCREARQRGKPVITFQQGVIGHTLDVPVVASKYVAFGKPSAAFLARMNGAFFQAAEAPEPRVEFVPGGCLVDNLIDLPNQFDQQTVLMVDVPNIPGDFWGLENQCQALLQLAERLLESRLPLRRLVIRPHPYWWNLDLEPCLRIARRFPNRCELSHAAWPLEDDLCRSSVVIGSLSGAVTVAAACGLPSIFLQTDPGYATGDLECFSPRQTLFPDAAFDEIARMLTDREAYAEAREAALSSGRQYYTNGKNLELDAKFFERLLRSDGPRK